MSQPEREKKLYEKKLKEFEEKFRKTMLDPNVSELMTDSGAVSWNTMNLWATAILMDEAITLSRLTRVLTVLTAILTLLTGVLAFFAVRGFHL